MNTSLDGYLGKGFLLCLKIILAIALAPLALYAAGVFYSGRRFKWQLQNYQLTRKSKAVLLLIGLTCLILLLIAFGDSVTSGGLAFPLLVLVFLGCSVAVLEAWAYLKQRHLRREIRHCLRRQEMLKRLIETNEERIKTLEKKNSAIEARHGRLIEEGHRLAERIRELVVQDARIWALKTQEWKAEFSKFNDQDVALRLKQLRQFLDIPIGNLSYDTIGCALQGYLLRHEEITRRVSGPNAQVESNSAQIEELREQNHDLQRQLSLIQNSVSIAEDTYVGDLRSKVVLD